MLGNMVAELRFGWLEIVMFQTTLTFWNLYEALKFTQNIWWTPGKPQPMWQVNFWSFEFFHFSRCMTGRVRAGLGKSLVIVRALVRRKERCLLAASKLMVVPIFFLLKFKNGNMGKTSSYAPKSWLGKSHPKDLFAFAKGSSVDRRGFLHVHVSLQNFDVLPAQVHSFTTQQMANT